MLSKRENDASGAAVQTGSADPGMTACRNGAVCEGVANFTCFG